MTSAGWHLEHRRPLRPGLPIATGKDATGGLGSIVFDRATRRPLMLSAHHVLVEPLGDGSVWQPAPCGQPGCRCNVVGRALRGVHAIVSFREHWYYVDAAVATVDDDVEWDAPIKGPAEPRLGMRVHKAGPATGSTEGLLVDPNHVDRVTYGFVKIAAPNQLAIRPTSHHSQFAARGDSGAVVHDDAGHAVGLLWGADGDGRGIACPIGPVLQELDVAFERS